MDYGLKRVYCNDIICPHFDECEIEKIDATTLDDLLRGKKCYAGAKNDWEKCPFSQKNSESEVV